MDISIDQYKIRAEIALENKTDIRDLVAFDHVSGKLFYSKDYDSLLEFMRHFDNVQYTIYLDN